MCLERAANAISNAVLVSAGMGFADPMARCGALAAVIETASGTRVYDAVSAHVISTGAEKTRNDVEGA